MPRKKQKRVLQEVALIFVEGDTEEEFYRKVLPIYLGNMPKRLFNLEGNRGIYNKIFDKTFQFLSNNPDKSARVFCFIDKESRYGLPCIDVKKLRKVFTSDKDFIGKVLSADVIVATQMIESWFFHDIEGIFALLRVPRKDRKPGKFKPVEKLTHIDLYRLFKRYGKAYIKGKRCQHLINSLDIEKIYRKCDDLRNGIALIIRRCK